MGDCYIVRRSGEVKKLPVLNASLPSDGSLVAGSGSTKVLQVEITKAGVPATYTYQWYKNGTAISNANGSTYTVTAEAAIKSDSYYCVVTNKAGTVTSRTATITMTVPVGSTATPVNAVNTWLLCASINPASYNNPSLASVVTNSALCTTLMNSQNAVDYMLRSPTILTAVAGSTTAISALDNSTPFISAQMTSNSAPTGYTAAASSNNDTAYKATAPMGGRDYANIGISSAWVYIKLPKPVWAYRIQGRAANEYYNNNTSSADTTTSKWKVQGSADGNSWTDLTDTVTTKDLKTFLPTNTNLFQYFRVYVSGSGSGSGYTSVRALKIWGKTKG